MKAFADDRINVTQKLKFALEWLECLARKGKMLVTSIFSFPSNVFKRHLSGGNSCLSGNVLIMEITWDKFNSLLLFMLDILYIIHHIFFQSKRFVPSNELRLQMASDNSNCVQEEKQQGILYKGKQRGRYGNMSDESLLWISKN